MSGLSVQCDCKCTVFLYDNRGGNVDFKVCPKCIMALLEEVNKPKPIASDLLCYISSYYGSATPVKIHLTCLRAFSDTEIQEARDLLFNAYPDKLGSITKRQDSPNKTWPQAVMEDIINAFSDLDVARSR